MQIAFACCQAPLLIIKRGKNKQDLQGIRLLATDLQEASAEVQSLLQSTRSHIGSRHEHSTSRNRNRDNDHCALIANDQSGRNIFDMFGLFECTNHRLTRNKRPCSLVGRDNGPNVRP